MLNQKDYESLLPMNHHHSILMLRLTVRHERRLYSIFIRMKKCRMNNLKASYEITMKTRKIVNKSP